MMVNPEPQCELALELVGIQSINPYVRNDAPARQAMASGHIGQALVIKGSTVRRQLTGAEREYGKYTHKIAFPCNAVIKRVIQRYPVTPLSPRGLVNPTTVVIYENMDKNNNPLEILEIPTYHSLHQYFGFTFVYTPMYYQLSEGLAVAEGTLIAHSPNLTEHGDYKLGIETQVAFMSIAAVIEDGVVITEDYAKRLTTTAFTKRIIKFGRKQYPLNMNGDLTKYKLIPDIGERVRWDGLLFASRRYDPLLSVIEMLPENLLRLQHYDDPVYAVPGATVIDVKVLRQSGDRTSLPVGMEDQIVEYYDRTLHFHREMIKVYNSFTRERQQLGMSAAVSPKLRNLLTYAYAMDRNSPTSKSKVQLTHGGVPIDEWEVEITLQYDLIPTVGYKLTDIHGGKAVICDVIPTEDAPLDITGNRADLIADSESSVNRTIMGRPLEQYHNASQRMTAINVRKMMDDGLPQEDTWKYLRGFYECISPSMLPFVDDPNFDIAHHLQCVYRFGIYIDFPPDAKVDMIENTILLSKHYPAPLGPITYRATNGKMVTTKRNVLIGGIYFILLEKIGNLWAAVSSAKLQHYGVPAKISKIDKHSAPGRNSSIRILGEAEVRLGSAVVGGDTIADIFDQTNSPHVHENVVENILLAPIPSQITYVVDRIKFPRGKGRVQGLANSTLRCAGIELVRTPTLPMGI